MNSVAVHMALMLWLLNQINHELASSLFTSFVAVIQKLASPLFTLFVVCFTSFARTWLYQMGSQSMTSLTWAPSPRTWCYETGLQWIINPKIASSLLTRFVVFHELRGRAIGSNTMSSQSILSLPCSVVHELHRFSWTPSPCTWL